MITNKPLPEFIGFIVAALIINLVFIAIVLLS